MKNPLKKVKKAVSKVIKGAGKVLDGAIDIVTKPFEKVTNNIAESAGSGAAEGLLNQLAERGLTQEFLDKKVTPALEGLASIRGLVQTVTPWIEPVGAAATASGYAIVGYLILRSVSTVLKSYREDQMNNEMRRLLAQVNQSLSNLQDSSRFQSLILLEQLAVQHKSLVQLSTWTLRSGQDIPTTISDEDRALIMQGMAAARENIRGPAPILLSNKVITALTVGMSTYLRGLFELPINVTNNEELLAVVSSSMDFEQLITVFATQNFSTIKLTVKDAINFTYLNKVTSGNIEILSDLIHQHFIEESGKILYGASVFTSLCSRDGVLQPYAASARLLNTSVLQAYKSATSAEPIEPPAYTYNVKDAVILLALQYRELKHYLVTDNELIQYLNCNDDPRLVEQVVSVILNRALLKTTITLNTWNTLRELGITAGSFATCYGVAPVVLPALPISLPVLAGLASFSGSISVIIPMMYSPATNAHLQFLRGQARDNVRYAANTIINFAAGVMNRTPSKTQLPKVSQPTQVENNQAPGRSAVPEPVVFASCSSSSVSMPRFFAGQSQNKQDEDLPEVSVPVISDSALSSPQARFFVANSPSKKRSSASSESEQADINNKTKAVDDKSVRKRAKVEESSEDVQEKGASGMGFELK